MKSTAARLPDDMYPVLDIGFRIINNYTMPSDNILTRIDVKIDNRQYNVCFASGSPKLHIAGEKFAPNDDLMTPKGVDACLNIKVNKQQLIDALKELVQDLENDREATNK